MDEPNAPEALSVPREPATMLHEVIVALAPERNPACVYLAGLGAGSHRTMRAALDTIAGIATGSRCDHRSCPWHLLRAHHTSALRARLAEIFLPASANKHLAALRGVLKAAWRLDYLTADEYQKAADLKSVKGQTLPRGRCLDQGELRALFAACGGDSTPAGVRDAAIIAVGYAGGLRRAEIVGLDVADFDAVSGAIAVRKAKGSKERVVYATNGTLDAINAWLQVGGPTAGPLFVPINKGGHPTLRRMTAQAVFNVLRKRADGAGVRGFSPHDLRRSFISDMLDAGADISTVQHLAGHSQTSTTQRYDRRGEATKKKAAELLHVPFVKPKSSEGK